MKNLLLILTILISSVVYSQSGYKLYSDIWIYDYHNGKSIECLPIDGSGSFSLDFDYVTENISEEEIRKYLLDELIIFRSDYGVNTTITESEELTKRSDEWADSLSGFFFEHSGDNINEVMASTFLMQYSRITPEDGNLNQIIAASIFDRFVMSKSHMEILLDDEDNIKFGFGLKITDLSMEICIQQTQY